MSMFLLLTYTLGFISIALGANTGDYTAIINIPQGSVQGNYQKSYGGRVFSAFEGIPFAKPPLGPLRFAEPEPADNWSGTLLANTTYMCMCFFPVPLLRGAKGSEDCLYIYVYVPRENIKGDEKLDVVVHIHGGAFMLGSPEYLAGPDYIMDTDVVYVTFNYRLAIFGFLSTEDDVVSGNNGLKDQSLALKWIKENIKYFGGNPESITLTGLSAGSCSVHLHYLSPWSKGLFHRGFSQSGTALQPWALTEEPLAKAKFVAEDLNCTTDSTKEMIDCLRAKSSKNIIMSMRKLFVFLDFVPFTPFGPVVEKGKNPFLPDHPYKLLTEGKVYDVPWIVSNVKDEGIYPAGFFIMYRQLKTINEKWNDIMPYALDINNTVAEADKIDVVTKVKQYYLKDEPLTYDNVSSLVQIFTDRTYLIDSEKALRAHSKAVKSPVYHYFFSYLLQAPPLFPSFIKGVAHSDDAKLLFHIISSPTKFEDIDERMIKLFVEFITNYAKGDKLTFNNVDWKPVDPGNEEIDFLHIASPDDVKMQKMKEMTPNKAFWNSLPIMENDKLF